MDLSCHTLAKLLKVPIPKDDVPFGCPSTSGPSVVHSLEALPTIHIEAEVEGDVDLFKEELNEVLTFNGGASEKDEITAALIDL